MSEYPKDVLALASALTNPGTPGSMPACDKELVATTAYSPYALPVAAKLYALEKRVHDLEIGEHSRNEDDDMLRARVKDLEGHIAQIHARVEEAKTEVTASAGQLSADEIVKVIDSIKR